MKKLALYAICVSALLVPNLSSAEDSKAIDHFDPMTSFEVVLKAPSVDETDKKQGDNRKQSKRSKSSKETLASAN